MAMRAAMRAVPSGFKLRSTFNPSVSQHHLKPYRYRLEACCKRHFERRCSAAPSWGARQNTIELAITMSMMPDSVVLSRQERPACDRRSQTHLDYLNLDKLAAGGMKMRGRDWRGRRKNCDRNLCLAPKVSQWGRHTQLNGVPARAITLP